MPRFSTGPTTNSIIIIIIMMMMMMIDDHVVPSLELAWHVLAIVMLISTNPSRHEEGLRPPSLDAPEGSLRVATVDRTHHY
jgi:hypothetical protein